MFKIKFARMFQESRGDVASALFVNRGLKARQNVNPFTLSQSGSAVRRKVPSEVEPPPPLPKKLPV